MRKSLADRLLGPQTETGGSYHREEPGYRTRTEPEPEPLEEFEAELYGQRVKVRRFAPVPIGSGLFDRIDGAPEPKRRSIALRPNTPDRALRLQTLRALKSRG